MPDNMMKLADVKIRAGFNVREMNGEVDEKTQRLAESIADVGIINPVTLDEEGYLIAGHRRVRAAMIAGVEEVPFRLEAGDEKRRLAVHGAENVARENLSPAEEAELVSRYLTAGYTEDGAARVMGVSKSLVTRRKVLLELPKDLRALWGPGGEFPLDLVPLVAEIVTKVPELGDVILHAEASRAPKRSQEELEQRREELRDEAYADGMEDDAYEDELDPVEPALPITKLLTEPHRYLSTLQRIYTVAKGERPGKGVPRWPNGVIIAVEGARFSDSNLAALGISEKLRERVQAATAQSRTAGVWHMYLSVGEADMDAGRATGVTIRLGETEFIYDLSWLKARIKSDMIPAFEQHVEFHVKEAAERKREERSTPLAKVPDEELTPQQRESRERDQARREMEKVFKSRAAAANEELGRALLNSWGEAKLDPKIAKIFAEASLGGRPPTSSDSVSKLAAAGLRYVMPGWPEVVATPTKANPKKTRTDYLPADEAVKKLWAWFDQAKTVEEIFGRAIVIHAAAMWASERVVAQSHRVGWSSHGTVVLPHGPGEQLRKLTAASVPAQVKKLVKDINEFEKAS